MGLPSHLQRKFDKEWEDWMVYRGDFALHVLCAGADAGRRAYELLNKSPQLRSGHVVFCLLRARFKWLHRNQYNHKQTDMFDSVKARMYLGLTESSYRASPDFREVSVPKYFAAKLEEWNKQRQDADEKEIDLLKKIRAVQGKVYVSRIFPPALRTIIFERDGYCCQECGRGKEKLIALGLHLEVDHIVSWEDGGKTTYSNGQTLCDECNRAKHHAKTYRHAKMALQKVA